MKKRTLMTAGSTALIAMLGVTAVIGATSSVPADLPLAAQSQHSTHGPVGGDERASAAASAPATSPADLPVLDTAGEEAGVVQPSSVIAPAAPAVKRPDRPAPGNSAGAPGQEGRVAPLPAVPSANGQSGKPQSLGEALAQPHGIAAAGVTPAGAGVNQGVTKQAPGLRMRSLARGEQDAGVNDAARTGGCALGYGDGRSCLPVAPPSAAEHAGHGMKILWTCEELLTLFPEGIPLQVPGNDPLKLDEDGNGVACA